MLAGLPQNPAHANPITNFERATRRQHVVLARMRDAGVTDAPQHDAALAEPLRVRRGTETTLHAEHTAETARQAVHTKYGQAA